MNCSLLSDNSFILALIAQGKTPISGAEIIQGEGNQMNWFCKVDIPINYLQ